MAHGSAERNTITYDAAFSSLREWAANWLQTMEAFGRDDALDVGAQHRHAQCSGQRRARQAAKWLQTVGVLAETTHCRVERNTVTFAAALGTLPREKRAMHEYT